MLISEFLILIVYSIFQLEYLVISCLWFHVQLEIGVKLRLYWLRYIDEGNLANFVSLGSVAILLLHNRIGQKLAVSLKKAGLAT